MTDDARDRIAAGVLGAAIVAAALGSSIQRDLYHAGRPARWVLLAAFGAVGIWRAWPVWRTWRMPSYVVAPIGVFLGLCVVSAGWSTSLHATIGRSAGEIVAVVGAAALAGIASRRPQLSGRLAEGIMLAGAIVAVGSVVYWIAEPSGYWGAYQQASVQYPARFRGLEFNPNTLAMLLAIEMPLAVGAAVDTRRRTWMRVSALGVLVICVVELALSGSRGGLLAGFGASFVTALLLPAARRLRVGLAGAVVIVLVIAAYASTIPKALPQSSVHRGPPAPHTVGIDAERVLPLEAEVGNPWWTHRRTSLHRAFFNTSVRGRALTGSVHRALERPLLGWGYGNEINAFVNRYYGFDSQNPENGYVGILLQLGVVGLVLFICAIGAAFVAGVRACIRHPDTTGAALSGASAAGILLGLSQSYFHGPGGIAFVAFWAALLLTSVLGPRREPARQGA